MSTFFSDLSQEPVLWAACAAMLLAFAGIMFSFWLTKTASYVQNIVMGFAAGMILTNALSMFSSASSGHAHEYLLHYVILGFFIFTLISVLSPGHTHDVQAMKKTRSRLLGLAPAIAIGLHSFMDGLEYTALYSIKMEGAYPAIAGLVLHEFAEGIIVYYIFIHANYSKIMAVLGAFIVAALLTPIAAVLSFYTYESLPEHWMFVFFAVSIGGLLFVGTTHFVPQLITSKKPFAALVAFVMGILLVFSLSLQNGHMHVH